MRYRKCKSKEREEEKMRSQFDEVLYLAAAKWGLHGFRLHCSLKGERFCEEAQAAHSVDHCR